MSDYLWLSSTDWLSQMITNSNQISQFRMQSYAKILWMIGKCMIELSLEIEFSFGPRVYQMRSLVIALVSPPIGPLVCL